jgi:hypothetical protein
MARIISFAPALLLYTLVSCFAAARFVRAFWPICSAASVTQKLSRERIHDVTANEQMNKHRLTACDSLWAYVQRRLRSSEAQLRVHPSMTSLQMNK